MPKVKKNRRRQPDGRSLPLYSGRPRRPELRVAQILDAFSEAAFAPEWQGVPLLPGTWKEELDAKRPDLLFVESAWAGNDGQWRHKLLGSKGPSEDVQRLVEYCREADIPTVFWNKEDPPHFEDFLPLARLFDTVYTSDSRMLPRYREALGHDNVHVLPFAAQSKIHNPVRPRRGWRQYGPAFAGMYFAHKYPERQAQMDFLLRGAAKAGERFGKPLSIYSRMAGKDPQYQFPAPLDKYVVGSLDYSDMVAAYKKHSVFLNVNSVVDSPSMCARRIFELLASGVPVVSAPSRALPEFFSDDELLVVDSQEAAEWAVSAILKNDELSDRLVHKAQRRIWKQHSYSKRASTILEDSGVHDSALGTRQLVSCLVSTNRPHQVSHVLDQFAGQNYQDKELMLLLHGEGFDVQQVEELIETKGITQFRILRAPEEKSLGECLNLLVSSSQGTILAKIDDDDFYGQYYLSDMLSSLEFSDADIVGKASHYMYLKEREILLHRFAEKEHRFVHQVMGPTIVGKRETFERNVFPELARGEDTAFLRRVSESGGSIYSADRFNFIQMRGSGSHTWNFTELEALATGVIQFYGDPARHVFL
ncbi:glycosyltransferase family protein [Arthrobacter cupressi]|nr:glycosyltransferase [Arthrobacter cupressi]NYD76489.1 spore maturation protein CgeB [Arthrobacter cupressi]